jgi:hypothetical protein
MLLPTDATKPILAPGVSFIDKIAAVPVWIDAPLR